MQGHPEGSLHICLSFLCTYCLVLPECSYLYVLDSTLSIMLKPHTLPIHRSHYLQLSHSRALGLTLHRHHDCVVCVKPSQPIHDATLVVRYISQQAVSSLGLFEGAQPLSQVVVLNIPAPDA